MRFGWGRFLFPFMALILAGCFQQAGDSLQSTRNTAAPFEPTTSLTIAAPVDDTSGETNETDDDQPTATIEINAQVGPQTPTALPITIIVQPTSDFSATTESSASGDEEGDPDEIEFITPNSPPVPGMETATPSQADDSQPTATPSGLITPTSLFEDGSQNVTRNVSGECTYTVQAGDNLFRIATNNDTTVDAMRAANPDLTGTNPVIQPGQVLNLPDCGGTDSSSSVEVMPTEVPPIITPAGSPPADTVIRGDGQIYIVERGDTLFRIAQQFGVTVDEIIAVNELPDPDRLDVGDEIFIPPGGNG